MRRFTKHRRNRRRSAPSGSRRPRRPRLHYALGALAGLLVCPIDADAQRPDYDDGFTMRLTAVVGTGNPGEDPGIFEPDLANDGSFACFHSRAVNLAPMPTDGTDHVYLLDPFDESPTPILVSRTGTGLPGNGDSHDAVLSRGRDLDGHSGRYVAFVSAADNLVPDDTNGIPDIFVYDRVDPRMARVSVASDGSEGTYSGTYESICHADAAISDDGRYVAFVSLASLAPEDDNEFADIYLHDRDHDEDGTFDEHDEPGGIRTWLVSLTERGESVNGHCGRPVISGNGEKLAWVSWASNVLPDSMPPDSNDDIDGFWTDAGLLRRKGIVQTQLITQALDGGWQNIGGCTPALSYNGRYVSFTSHSTNLAPMTGPQTTPPPNESEVALKAFLRDMWETRPSKIIHISKSRFDGGPANGDSFRTVMCEDEFRLFVAFASDATDLVLEDGDPFRDVYLAKIRWDAYGRPYDSELHLGSLRFPVGDKSGGHSNDVAISNRSNIAGILFTSIAPVWAEGEPAEAFDLYLSGKRLR